MERAGIKSTASESFADRLKVRQTAQSVVSVPRAVATGSKSGERAVATGSKSQRASAMRSSRVVTASFDLKSIKPDDLRETVYQALAKLPSKERVEVTKELLGQLRQAGISVGSRLFILGIPASTAEDLTPSDVAKLLRSVHMSNPPTMKAVSATLNRLLSRDERTEKKRAA